MIPNREIPFSPLLDNWMCQTYCVRTWLKYTVERYPKKYIVKSMRIHTNTNTIYQWRCKSWSLRQLVQPHFSWFSCLPMAASAWQAWRSLRVFDTRQVVRSVSHFVYQFVEFVIVLGQAQIILSKNDCLIITINDTSTGDLPLIITISDKTWFW